MSPVYRGERNQFSFHGEAGFGGYLDYISTVTDTGGASTTLSSAAPAGSRSITVASAAGYVATDYVQVGTAANGNAELRRVQRVVGSVIYLDYPLGFHHASADTVDEKTIDGTLAGNSFATFLPGVYESVSTPDMQAEFTPHWLLGTASNRNPYITYRGAQAFVGGLPNFILLNGFPLRFGLGQVTTVASAVTANTTTLSGAHAKGQRVLTLAAAGGLTNGSFIEIDRGGTNPEVRQIISGGGTTTVILNYPIMIAHATGLTVTEVNTSGVTYTHTIAETVDLDSMTWHLLMRDSGGTVANDFIRRWVGGKVNRMVLSADERGVLRCSWDDVIFQDLVHNQQNATGITGDITKYSGGLIAPTGVGTAIPHSGGALGTATFPTNQPYYFSQGAITLFGVTIARIRNFRIEVDNNLDPRYYVRDQATERIPTEIIEQRRQYRMSATIAMEDSPAATATTRTLFKELILEGNYTAGFTGFDISLVFTRGTGDTLTITIPPSAAATGGDAQGAFFVRAQHPVTPESPVQVQGDIIFRSMRISAVDAMGVYP